MSNLHKKNLTIGIIILLLVFGNIFFAVKYFLQVKETEKIQKEIESNVPEIMDLYKLINRSLC